MGTPDYISPEQARQSHEVDIRTDVYSLGCTLYYLLSGRPPFPGGSLGEKLVKHQLGEPAPVERLRPEVPAGVAGVVRKMMAKDVRDRYQTPGEVAEVLASGLSSGKWPAATRPASPTSAYLPRPPVATLVTAGQADGAAPMALVAGPGLLPAVPVAVTPAPSETLVEGRSPILKETLFAGVPVIALAIYIAVVAGLALIGLLFSRR
jgi:serine/threonine-protein kinase